MDASGLSPTQAVPRRLRGGMWCPAAAAAGGKCGPPKAPFQGREPEEVEPSLELRAGADGCGLKQGAAAMAAELPSGWFRPQPEKEVIEINTDAGLELTAVPRLEPTAATDLGAATVVPMKECSRSNKEDAAEVEHANAARAEADMLKETSRCVWRKAGESVDTDAEKSRVLMPQEPRPATGMLAAAASSAHPGTRVTGLDKVAPGGRQAQRLEDPVRHKRAPKQRCTAAPKPSGRARGRARPKANAMVGMKRPAMEMTGKERQLLCRTGARLEGG